MFTYNIFLKLCILLFQELFPADEDHSDDIFRSGSQEGNIFKRLFKLSKEKVTKSSSFVTETMADGGKTWQRKGSIVVSGNDDFIARLADISPDKGAISHIEQAEKVARETDQFELSSANVHFMGDSLNDGRINLRKFGGGKKTRKRILASEARETSATRDNSMIW